MPLVEGKAFFFAKKNQKTLISAVADQMDKSFLVLFFKKELLRLRCLGAYGGVSKTTGKTMRAPFAHVWRVADGRLRQFDMYADTLLITRAMQP